MEQNKLPLTAGYDKHLTKCAGGVAVIQRNEMQTEAKTKVEKYINIYIWMYVRTSM